MPFCQSCGKEVKEEQRYCPYCGASVAEVPKTPKVGSRREYEKEREACFGPPGSGAGLWGLISGGVFLIGLAVLWYFDWFWPGILFLIAIMIIIGGIVSYNRR